MQIKNELVVEWRLKYGALFSSRSCREDGRALRRVVYK